jgi:hypothetical protein
VGVQGGSAAAPASSATAVSAKDVAAMAALLGVAPFTANARAMLETVTADAATPPDVHIAALTALLADARKQQLQQQGGH